MEKRFKSGWTAVPNEIINNSNISLKAKGLWLYINSKPKTWEFSISGVCSQCKDGRDGIRTAIKELEEQGYLQREQKKLNDGTFGGYEWYLYDYQSNTTVVGKSDDGKSDDGNSTQVIKTKEIKTKVNSLIERKQKFEIILGDIFTDLDFDVVREFYEYWTEHGENDKKMRFEKEKSFDVNRRMKTWLKNKQKWEKEKTSGKKEKGLTEKLKEIDEWTW